MLFTGGITSPIAENLRKTRLNFGKERIVHKIFIVEDDPVIARLVAEQLERWGYEAVCARDFAHVLEEFVAAAPQLVLLDIRLPSYSGYHWCSQIRRVSRVPVIFLSSAADNLNQVMALSLGADDFIAKPFDLDLLLAKIQALLRRTYEFGGEGAADSAPGRRAGPGQRQPDLRRPPGRADQERVRHSAHSHGKPRPHREPGRT